jgi:hypothetical protein
MPDNISIEDEPEPHSIVRVYWHCHPLKSQEIDPERTWICDSVKYFGRCLEGITEGDYSVGHKRWRDEVEDFDLCASCIKLSERVRKMMKAENPQLSRINDVILTYNQFFKDANQHKKEEA